MKIYVDLLLFLNFSFDFLLLLTTAVIQKRKVSFKRLTLGSLLGSITIMVLFIPFTSLTLFILKILLSILIILSTFGYKDLKYTLNNLFYFYITSIILGGFLYYLNIEFSYKNIGMIFYHKGLSINYIFILLFAPIILLIYKKQIANVKLTNSLHFKVDVYIKDKIITLNSYLDTGNTLKDPYTNKKVIITNSKEFISHTKDLPYFFIPYESINTTGLLKCYKINKAYIDRIGFRKDVVVGIVNEKLKVNGIDCILNNLLMEENI